MAPAVTAWLLFVTSLLPSGQAMESEADNQIALFHGSRRILAASRQDEPIDVLDGLPPRIKKLVILGPCTRLSLLRVFFLPTSSFSIYVM